MADTHVPSDDEDGAPVNDREALLERIAMAERDAARRLPSDEPRDPERRRRTEATRAELLGQPEVVRRNWTANGEALRASAARIAAHRVDHVYLVGAGDSLAVAVAARAACQLMLGVGCEPVQSLEFARYGAGTATDRSLVIAMSSSGETTATVHAMLEAQARGALTVALSNTPTSTLAAQSTTALIVDATRIGWPTQSSTAPLALLLRMVVLVGQLTGATGARQLLDELDTLPELMAETIRRADPRIRGQARHEVAATMSVFTGAGPNLASALVGAAKVKECTPDHAVAVQLEEFHHYNSVKRGEPVWMFVPSGSLMTRALDTVHEAHRLGGHVRAVTTDGESALDAGARSVLHLPAVSDALSALLYFLPAQLVGYHLAMAKFARADTDTGTDTDTRADTDARADTRVDIGAGDDA